jgi:hypothetical protein
MEIAVLSSHWFWYSFFTLIGIFVGVISYRSSFPPLRRFWRIFLAILRGVMIFLLGLFLIEPVLNLYSSKLVQPELAVLVDHSKSMGVAVEGNSRIDLADSLTRQILSNLGDDYKLFSFSDSLFQIEDFPITSDLRGDATSIERALRDFGSRKDFDGFSGILLITDGRQNLGGDPVKAGMKLNIPVYTMTLGEMIGESNLAIDEVISPAIAYSGDIFRIQAQIGAEGIEAKKSRVYLKIGNRVVAERPFNIPREGRKTEIEFDIMAPAPGVYEYAISIPVLDGERESVDNERILVVRVLKNKIRIFLGSGSLDWEYKFINQSLSGFDEFEVDGVFPEGGGRFSSPGVPGSLEDLEKYDIVLLVDSSPRKLRMAVSDLKKYVEDGGSLIYMAGASCLSDIGSFDDLLPLDLRKPVIMEGEFFFETTPAQKHHAAIKLDDDPVISRGLWSSLPPISRSVSGINPTGDILLETKHRRRGGGSIPVLTVSNYGHGRVAAVTGYPFWRSHFGSAKDNRLANVIPGFWRNLARWATAVERSGNFRIITDRKVYRLGEPVLMTGYLYDEASRPRDGALVEVSIIPRGVDTPIKDAVLTQTGSGIYISEISSLPAGDYVFNAIASSYGDTAGSTSGEFTIEKSSLEMASLSPDYNLTRRIAEATGAVAYTKNDFEKFSGDLKLTPYTEETHTRIRPFGMPLFLIILLAGLSIEWGLRKKFRLP